ncbi:UvrD-helicase domain-containing protein [Pleomorphovibrio marinus]|uniref:UvrD-helicase domain-containing protein n=1 Tax=Pleomorphovibrio marinus TaxID=2164132 RepID=UPI000E0B4A5B|nr:UvrD-helicase domain-containing protein [Pleomorphovibrio marinus]
MQPTLTPFIIYKSSAGSGKTYTLTMEYLKLALRQPGAFRQILAVTFTNKATTEMKERILKELTRLTREVNPQEKMDAEILSFLQVDAVQLKALAKSTLTSLLHDYGSFSISTIDSFFQRVIRAFAREIDLQARFDVEMDQEGVLSRLVDRLLVRVMEDEHLHRWLVSYAIDRIREGKTWDIKSAIGNLGRELFQESFKTHKLEIREFLKERENLDGLKQYLQRQKSNIAQQAGEIKTKSNAIRERHGLDWTDFKGGTRTFSKYFDLLGDPREPLPKLTAAQLTPKDEVVDWVTKSSKKKEQVEEAFREGLGELWGQLLSLYPPYKTIEAIRKNFYVYGVFRQLLEALEELKEDENIMLISDANDFLKSITANNDAPFIYEKVGNRFKHFLIDEFQDTSGFQWASFRPLLVNALAQGNVNLLVGDVKQSIYRWRGGELRLLLETVESELGHFGIDVKPLDTNFRSLPKVVNFNNTLFSLLPKQLSAVLQDSHGVSNTDILESAYKEVTQKIYAKKEALDFHGKVKLEFLDAGDEEQSMSELILDRIPEMVIQLQEMGYRPRDIAFLVRKNQEGQQVADTLLSYGLSNPNSPHSFDVLSEEALLIRKAEKVKCLVAAMKYLKDGNPSHQQSLWLHYAQVMGKEITHRVFDKENYPDFISQRIAEFENKKLHWLKLPLVEMVNELADWFSFHDQGKEKAYLAAFKEAVMDFSSKFRADLTGFLKWWEEKQDKLTVRIPEGHDAIRILTIHKSKGLQFKVVLMPFLDWKIVDHSKGTVVWTPFTLEEEQLSSVVPINMGPDLMDSLFEPVYQEELIMAYLDTINMAYVAFTRAEEVFWGLSPWKDTSKHSMGNLGINILKVLETESLNGEEMSLSEFLDEEKKVFEYGEWPAIKNREMGVLLPPRLRWSQQSWQKKLKVKTSSLSFDDQVEGRVEKLWFGQLVHSILERARNEHEVKVKLEELYFEGVFQEPEKNRIESQISKLFSLPVFANWFSTEAKILTEQGIMLPDGSQKRPDRVVIYRDHAEVVDFKTGLEHRSHQGQVKDYMQLVKTLLKLPTEGFICYLDTITIKEVT